VSPRTTDGVSPDQPGTRLTPERWRQVEAVFLATRDRGPGERATFLTDACGADVALRLEVESLLAADQGATGFLEPPGGSAPAVRDLEAALRAELAGRYTLERELGRGGMAMVYLGQDLKHHRAVAVKVLRGELAGAIGPERFLREIEIAAGLSHPHILPLFDSGGHDGLYFYVMPYVEGETLRQRLERERQLPIADALRITREVGDALGYAHSLGFVHRDIKPENILFSHDHAVVADFGIARAITAAGGGKLTEAGLALGTPSYMSPEQAVGDSEVDGRSDLYSLGCVLYEMLVGDPPFRGHNAQQILARHVMDPVPPPRTVRATVPLAVQDALLRALAKVPADRYATVHQFVEALDAPGISDPEVTVTFRSPAPAQSIAVLSFLNMSGDPDNDYFGDGIAEELINLLTGVKGLRVASRTSAFVFKETKADPRTIGQTLNVQTVLTGSVRKVGNRLRITAQLINAADGYHLWSDRYDREMADVLAIQDEISQTIVNALQIRLTGEQVEQLAKRGTADPEAYNLYLRGRYSLLKRTPAALALAVEYLEQAVGRDHAYAAAYASLAEAWFFSGFAEFGTLAPSEAMPKARAAALEAQRLDPTLPEPYLWMGAVRMVFDWDLAGAGEAFRRALELRPDAAYAMMWYSLQLSVSRRYEEALLQITRAKSLDPLSLNIQMGHVRICIYAGQYEEALRLVVALHAAEPDHVLVTQWLAQALIAAGRPLEAIGVLDAVPQGIRTRQADGLQAVALALVGERDRAARLAAWDESVRPAGPIGVAALLLVGQTDRAVAMLERLIRERSAILMFTGSVVYRPLHVEPRTASLLRGIGVPFEELPSADA
jgi:eukaryotic-like serine/threonine-protein kinase